jgi:hypothetical protein
MVTAISFVLFERNRAEENASGNPAIIAGIKGEDATSSQSADRENAIKTITVDTMDGTAQVIDGERSVGATPFQVKAHVGESVNLILRRDGFEDLPVQFDVNERHVYTYILKPRKDR